nr:MAG TPA: hypothetical protein [Caudoviricetes sp.]
MLLTFSYSTYFQIKTHDKCYIFVNFSQYILIFYCIRHIIDIVTEVTWIC